MSYLVFTFRSLGMFGFPPTIVVPATSFKGDTAFRFCFDFSLLMPLAVVLLLWEACAFHKYTTYVSSMHRKFLINMKIRYLLSKSMSAIQGRSIILYQIIPKLY